MKKEQKSLVEQEVEELIGKGYSAGDSAKQDSANEAESTDETGVVTGVKEPEPVVDTDSKETKVKVEVETEPSEPEPKSAEPEGDGDTPMLGKPPRAREMSNRQIHDMVSTNRRLQMELAELKRQIGSIRGEMKPIEKPSRPSRSQFKSEDDYLDRMVSWKLEQANNEANKKREEENKAGEDLERRRDSWKSRVTSQYGDEDSEAFKAYNNRLSEASKNGVAQMISKDTQKQIESSLFGPFVLDYLCEFPDDIETVNGLNPYDRAIVFNQIATQMQNRLKANSSNVKSANKVKAVGKVTGSGRPNVNEMTQNDMIEAYRKGENGFYGLF